MRNGYGATAECHARGRRDSCVGARGASAGTFGCVLGCSGTQPGAAGGSMVLTTSWQVTQLRRPLPAAARGTMVQTPLPLPPCPISLSPRTTS